MVQLWPAVQPVEAEPRPAWPPRRGGRGGHASSRLRLLGTHMVTINQSSQRERTIYIWGEWDLAWINLGPVQESILATWTNRFCTCEGIKIGHVQKNPSKMHELILDICENEYCLHEKSILALATCKNQSWPHERINPGHVRKPTCRDRFCDVQYFYWLKK